MIPTRRNILAPLVSTLQVTFYRFLYIIILLILAYSLCNFQKIRSIDLDGKTVKLQIVIKIEIDDNNHMS